MKTLWKKLSSHLLLMTGLMMLVLLLSIAWFGEHLPFIEEEPVEEAYRNEGGVITAPPYEPSKEYWLGTDRDGRDMLSLIVLGAKETLLIVLVITMLRYLVGIPLAYLAYKKVFGFNALITSLNTLFSYLPTIIVVVMLAILPPILFTENRPYLLILIIAVAEVGRVANTIKEDLQTLSTEEYMESGLAVGNGPIQMFRRYYLPFLYDKLIVYFVSELGKVMFLLGQLGFIGIFISQNLVQVDPAVFEIHNDSYSWPMLLQDAFMDIRGPVWIVFWPAFAMAWTIFICNMIAQGVQQVIRRKDAFM